MAGLPPAPSPPHPPDVRALRTCGSPLVRPDTPECPAGARGGPPCTRPAPAPPDAAGRGAGPGSYNWRTRQLTWRKSSRRPRRRRTHSFARRASSACSRRWPSSAGPAGPCSPTRLISRRSPSWTTMRPARSPGSTTATTRSSASFATEQRVIVGYDDIPEILRNGIIAGEDASFFEHAGLSIPDIIRTAARNILRGDLVDAGASTLTMQLARNITVGGEQLGLQKTWQRKLREVYYTFHIEKRYTKREILTLYCNQMYLGSGAYGIEAAARMYFGKTAQDLELHEAALIAGIFQSPGRQSPRLNPDLALGRRDYVLRRMAEEGYITADEAEEASTQPLQLAPRSQRNNSVAPYFIEEVRQHLEHEYGADRLYEDGLVVRSTLDAGMQRVANRAVEKGLRDLDKKYGFRTPVRNLIREGENLDTFRHDRWRYAMRPGDVVPAVVTAVDGGVMTIRFGRAPHEYRAAGLRVTTAARQLPVDPETIGRRARRTGRPHRGGDRLAPRGRRPGGRHTRPGARNGGGAARDRKPHWACSRDGRRIRLRTEQVQPRHAGISPARLALQGRAVRRGHRPGVHHVVHRARRTGELRRRPQSGVLRAEQPRQRLRGPHHAAPGPGKISQRPGGLADETRSAHRPSSTLRNGSALDRRFPRISPLRSARRRRPSPRSRARTRSSRTAARVCRRIRSNGSSIGRARRWKSPIPSRRTRSDPTRRTSW